MSDANQEDEDTSVTIRIPESAHEPLKQIIVLDDHLFARLIGALSKAKPQTSQGRFEDQILSNFPDVDDSNIRTIVSELFRLDFVRSQGELSAEDTAELISDSVSEVGESDFDIGKDEVVVLRERIAELLKFHEPVTLTSKASDLLMEHPHIYYNAKLYSDMRPIFSTSGDSIEAALIIHNLVIHHRDGEEHKDFYVALDDVDLSALRAVLDRAEQKAAALDFIARSV